MVGEGYGVPWGDFSVSGVVGPDVPCDGDRKPVVVWDVGLGDVQTVPTAVGEVVGLSRVAYSRSDEVAENLHHGVVPASVGFHGSRGRERVESGRKTARRRDGEDAERLCRERETEAQLVSGESGPQEYPP